MSLENMLVFTGTANADLAIAVMQKMDVERGKCLVTTFSDGEVRVEIEENVRGRDVYVIQPTSAPVNDTLVELAVMVDALRWASAARITAVVPYFGYARQDRRPRSARVPITSRLAAKLLSDAGANRVLTMDLHNEAVQGFFDIPVDNIYAQPVLVQDIIERYKSELVIVSPDVGGVVRARAFAKCINDSELAIIDKRRPDANKSEVMHVIGDVENKHCVIIDDMIDTAGTLCKAATSLKQCGARSVAAYCTHGVLSGPAMLNIKSSNELDEVVITNTIAQPMGIIQTKKLRRVDVSSMLAETIKRLATNGSVTSLFQ